MHLENLTKTNGTDIIHYKYFEYRWLKNIENKVLKSKFPRWHLSDYKFAKLKQCIFPLQFSKTLTAWLAWKLACQSWSHISSFCSKQKQGLQGPKILLPTSNRIKPSWPCFLCFYKQLDLNIADRTLTFCFY